MPDKAGDRLEKTEKNARRKQAIERLLLALAKSPDRPERV